jgi:predicted nucleic acid-binding protein
MLKGVLVDTSFLLRFLNEDDALFGNADAWFKHLLDRNVPMYLSTIAIAEYCVGGSMDQLPLRYMRVLPFNIGHAVRAGAFRAAFRGAQLAVGERPVITNDVKLFAQADTTPDISHFLTADDTCQRIHTRIVEADLKPSFAIMSIRTPIKEVLGEIDFPDLGDGPDQ